MKTDIYANVDWSRPYRAIAADLGRNVSTVGWQARRRKVGRVDQRINNKGNQNKKKP